MKDPAFLFYPNDWIGGTMGMTFEEKGAYMELLMMQFNRGHMTSHMIGQTVGQLWVNIQDKFVQDQKGLWYNVRLELEQEKRKKYTESRRNNIEGKNKYTSKDKNPTKTSGHMTSHMENENENENNKDNSVEIFKNSLDANEKLIKDMLSFFSIREISNNNQYRFLCNSIVNIVENNEIELFKSQFYAYKNVKESKEQEKHGFDKYIGTHSEKYHDGVWYTKDWTNEAKKLNKTESPTRLSTSLSRNGKHSTN